MDWTAKHLDGIVNEWIPLKKKWEQTDKSVDAWAMNINNTRDNPKNMAKNKYIMSQWFKPKS